MKKENKTSNTDTDRRKYISVQCNPIKERFRLLLRLTKVAVRWKWEWNIGVKLPTGGNGSTRGKPLPLLQPSKLIPPWLSRKRCQTSAFRGWWQSAWSTSVTHKISVLTTQRTRFMPFTQISQLKRFMEVILCWNWHETHEHTLWQMRSFYNVRECST